MTQEVCTKDHLFRLLDKCIRENGLTDLHTHLMGMGSADFWVSHIIEGYIFNSEEAPKSKKETKYHLKDLMSASGFRYNDSAGEGDFNNSLERSLFEARFFEGFDEENLQKTFDQDSEGMYITNKKLVELLHEEDERCDRKGPLRALVRNWFEFLSSDGQSAPLHTEILQTCKNL